MKLARKSKRATVDIASSATTARNQSRRGMLLIIVILVTAALIAWVYLMSQRATSTVQVVMTTQPIYKNQQITADMVTTYDMIKAEYDKYTVLGSNGQVTRRIIRADEMDKLVGYYAAYPMQENTLVEISSVYRSKIDNSDSVLYSFPGKEIVTFDVANQDLTTFKTFLQPGDRINITAIFSEEESVTSVDAYGITNRDKVITYRTEEVFKDILLADLLNTNGDSILDMYEDYNNKSVTQQAALDRSTTWQESVRPVSMLVALTPEEKDLYYYYLSKGNIEFRMSLPQRAQ